jgi:hypothetical protein
MVAAVKRYRVIIGDSGCGPSCFAAEDPDGEWVDAEEAMAALAELRAALRDALRRLKTSVQP